MNPRERLIENIIDLVHARTGHAYDEALGDLLEATLKTHYAIGRWVSVEERLPEFDRINGWGGCVLWKDDGKPTFGDWVHPHFNGHYFTHWLELNLPENHNE